MSIVKVKAIVSEVKPKEAKPSLEGLQVALAGVTTADISRLKNIPTRELQTHWREGYNAIQARAHQLELNQAAKLQRQKIAAHDAAESGKYSGTGTPAKQITTSRRSGPRKRP